MEQDRPPRLAVYCGSRVGDDPAFTDAARRVGEGLAARGADLIFGAGQFGLMGIVANAAIEGGRHVIGVIPHHLAAVEVPHEALSELRMVDDMASRKREMYENADGFLTLPGGVGTMEEMFEVLSWGVLGLHPKPMGLLDVNGYYDHLVAFLRHSVDQGLTKAKVLDLLIVEDDVDRLLDRLLPATGSAAEEKV